MHAMSSASKDFGTQSLTGDHALKCGGYERGNTQQKDSLSETGDMPVVAQGLCSHPLCYNKSSRHPSLTILA